MEWEEKFQKILNEEKERLGLNQKIEPVSKETQILDWLNYSASTIVMKIDDKYVINISEDDQRNNKFFRKAIKHELYHIHKGDCDKKCGSLLEYFLQETRAKLYEHFSLKL